MGAFLPADQGHALMKAAGAVMELHSECSRASKREALAAASCQASARSDLDSAAADKGEELKATASKLIPSGTPKMPSIAAREAESAPSSAADGVPRSRSLGDLGGVAAMSDMLNKAVLADPAGTIFSAAENVLTDKTDYDNSHMMDAAVEGEGGETGGERGGGLVGKTASMGSATTAELPSRMFDGKSNHDLSGVCD